jgi:hypothetical protein
MATEFNVTPISKTAAIYILLQQKMNNLIQILPMYNKPTFYNTHIDKVILSKTSKSDFLLVIYNDIV